MKAEKAQAAIATVISDAIMMRGIKCCPTLLHFPSVRRAGSVIKIGLELDGL